MKTTTVSAAMLLLSAAVIAGENIDTDQDVRAPAEFHEKIRRGDRTMLGSGRISAIQATGKDGAPLLIGIEFPESVLDDLPDEHSDGLNCWDSNGDDAIDLEECDGGHERVLYFEDNKSPFKYIVVNWEPHGHIPADVYDTPHFDFHFYIMDNIARRQIAVGPCSGVMNCAQTEIAILPLRSGYIHPDFFNTKLAFARMGNHWIDGKSPEFNGGKFTHTFIQGSYDAKLIFYEPMVSLEYLASKPNQCTSIKQPSLYEEPGYYPTRYCIRHNKSARMYRVTLEKFVYRYAAP